MPFAESVGPMRRVRKNSRGRGRSVRACVGESMREESERNKVRERVAQ